MRPFGSLAVAEVFQAYPVEVRRHLLVLRALIFETAATTESVGEIEETLKWGEPAYVTTQSRSGSTVRLGWKRSNASRYGIYFNCRTSLVPTFRTLFPDELRFEGNRAIMLKPTEALPLDALAFCVAAALTYHRRTDR